MLFFSVIDIFAIEVRASGLRAPKAGEKDNNDAPLFLNLDGNYEKRLFSH